ncbi:MAG TPA: hypothetical protein DG753_12750 [Clostridium sp.]|nr:hypothetical protein [Clostridium sp.]
MLFQADSCLNSVSALCLNKCHCSFDGTVGQISKANECTIELRCKTELVKDALKTIKQIHPYEEPVINILPILNNLFE